MVKRIVATALLVVLAAVPAASQVQLEIMGYGGYTFSNGIDPETSFGRIDITPLSGFSYGAGGGLWFNEFMEIGFLWSHQESELRVRGPLNLAPMPPPTNELTFTGFGIDNFHGFFAYHWGYRNAPAKPFFLFGMGATYYNSLDIAGQSVSGSGRFSTTWGLGVKVFPDNGKFGGMLMARWTPTYITSDPGGVWCDPYWGCTSYGNPKYSHQFDIAAGLTLRFGETRRGF
jgi:hypothetical protein